MTLAIEPARMRRNCGPSILTVRVPRVVRPDEIDLSR